MSVEEIPQGSDVNVISNKNEKKARELIKKLNLKQIKGISRVTFKQRGNLIYAIDQPDVYRSAAGTYVVFGEAKVDDMNQRIAEAQAQQAQQEALTNAAKSNTTTTEEDKSPESITADLEKASLNNANKVEEVDDEDDEEIDESEFDPKDIALIVEQTHVSRAKAVKALKNHDGDMVNALMELS
ncbi:EGD2 [Candida pseudojiufengensis]|uniref:EGD2 n=1 Tax=Candida pseudojiufengensis TaxID=497109 RepID=UPI002224366B|nr:EGD2 [Candida pseudojiufengensis]KAI5966196.1 EGD2 [Candida pseudojiufengensis]